jgi:hypothetical protein
MVDMPTVKVEPSKDHPMPYGVRDAPVPTMLEELAVAGKTAELQAALGATLEFGEAEEVQKNELLEKLIASNRPQQIRKPAVALAAAEFLKQYGTSVAIDIAEVRSAVTYKLMELANNEDAKIALKALELLGKHSDIGLFTNRSELTINYKNPEDLENAIKDRVKRLLNADIIDITPIGVDLDAELGFATPRQEPEDGEIEEGE